MADLKLKPHHMANVVASIQKGRCILFLGPHAACGPDGRTVEDEIERHIRDELGPRATADMTVEQLSLWLGDLSKGLLQEHVVALVQEQRAGNRMGACHETLAQIPFTLVLQTTPDPFMENALRTARGAVQTQIYDYSGAGETPLADIGSKECPLVYYLRGSTDCWKSMPLTAAEDINHLVALVREQPELPPALTAVMRASGKKERCTAVFVGFDFNAWQTRMLLHGLFSTGRSAIIKPEPTAVATHSLGRRPGLNGAMVPVAGAGAPGAPLAGGAAGGATQLDAEFLWTSYNVIFANEAPEVFAQTLLLAWQASVANRPQQLPAAHPAVLPEVPRKINRLNMRRLLGQMIPLDLWQELCFVNAEFAVQNQQVLRHEVRSEAAGMLINWIEERNLQSLEPLMEQLQELDPAAYPGHEVFLLSPGGALQALAVVGPPQRNAA